MIRPKTVVDEAYADALALLNRQAEQILRLESELKLANHALRYCKNHHPMSLLTIEALARMKDST